MKIAIPVKAGHLESHFGHAREFTFVTVDEGEVQATETLDAPLEHGGLPGWLARARADVVIVGGLGQRAFDRMSQSGIEVVAGAPQGSPEELVRSYLAGTLGSNVEICTQHGDGHGHGHGHGHGGGGCGKHDD
jgi:predicted Fe-Mo cluster-binding NifX family protein